MDKKPKIEIKNILLSFLGSIFFCNWFIFFVLISKAQAGGYDEPIPPTTSSSPTAPNEQIPTLSLLNWNEWGNSYWRNDMICRENNGNVICLSPQLARQLRWEIPAQNQSMNP